MKVLAYEKTFEFIRQSHALRFYCMKSYKDFIFHKVKNLDRSDGKHYVELYTEPNFEKVYGPIKVNYSVKNGKLKFESISPEDLFEDGHRVVLKTYKGVPYRNAKDILKIKFLLEKEN